MNLNPVLTILGWALSALACLMLVPIMFAFDIGTIDTAGSFLVSSIVTLFVGGGLIFASRRENTSMERRQSFLAVTMVWVILPLFAAMPFYFSGISPNLIDAYFEAMSGFTTTGASVFTNVEALPRSIMFWRALLEWFGGFSLIIMLSILATTVNDMANNSLGRAIAKSNRRRLSRRVRYAVLSILGVYSFLTVSCIVLLWIAGMAPFDAICYAFSTISTGGFMISNSGAELFSGRLIEMVLMIFMVIGAIDFALHWAFFNGDRKAYFQNPEYRYLVYMLIALIAVTFTVLLMQTDIKPTDSMRYAMFNSVSALTTTGFMMPPMSNGQLVWPIGVVFLMLLAATIGGSTGSTAGGVKLLRIIMLLKLGLAEVRRLSFPRAVILLKYGKENITKDTILATWAFFAFYLFAAILVSLGLALTDLDMEASLTLALANLANAGAIVSTDLIVQTSESPQFVSYEALSSVAKIILCVAMLVGRLEFFAILTLLNPALWRR